MSSEKTKNEIFEEVETDLRENGFTIVDMDKKRPWGGFFVIDEEQAPKFVEYYFENIPIKEIRITEKLSPKILVVQPEKRLSWQYHLRRAEIWNVLEGPVGVVSSETDEQGPVEEFESGEYVKLKQGERHRLVGLDDWGILAEIWQHTDPENPSNEEDIIRLEDDFGR